MSKLESLFNDMSDDVKHLIETRKTIISWYIFYHTDKHPYLILPLESDAIYDLIDYAEDNLEKCDRILAKEYEEYIPQF